MTSAPLHDAVRVLMPISVRIYDYQRGSQDQFGRVHGMAECSENHVAGHEDFPVSENLSGRELQAQTRRVNVLVEYSVYRSNSLIEKSENLVPGAILQ